MLGKIMRHEWRLLVRDRTIWSVTAICAILVGYSVHAGVAWLESHRSSVFQMQDEGAAELRGLQARLAAAGAADSQAVPASQREASGRDPADPYAVGGVPQGLVLKPGALAALSVGQSDLQPQSVRAVIYSTPQEAYDETSFRSPLALAAGRFDLAFVLVYLFPLLIIGLSYNLLSVEREQGTLPLLLSQPLRLRTVVLGKALLRVAVLCGLVVGFSLLAFGLAGADLGAEGTVTRLGLWVAVTLAYAAFWFALALAVATRGWSSATNAIALVAAWLALVVVAPALLHLAASVRYPPPSRAEFLNQMRASSADIRRDGSRLLARYYEDHPEMVPESAEDGEVAFDFAKSLLLVYGRIDRESRAVEDGFERQLAAQQRLVARLRFLSPAILAQQALNDLAGTSVERYRAFRAQVRAFQAEWKAFFVPRVMKEQRLTPSDYESMPRFELLDEPFSEVAGRVSAALLGLLVPAGGIAVWALLGFRRYPLV